MSNNLNYFRLLSQEVNVIIWMTKTAKRNKPLKNLHGVSGKHVQRNLSLV